jgi:hypothetical protein
VTVQNIRADGASMRVCTDDEVLTWESQTAENDWHHSKLGDEREIWRLVFETRCRLAGCIFMCLGSNESRSRQK